MRKAIDTCSFLCGAVSLLTLIFGIKALTGKSYFIGLSLFNMAAKGTFFGFVGNLLGIVITCAGFGAMAFCGFKYSSSSKRKGFIYGAAMTVICLLSAIASIISRSFGMGDIMMLILPAAYTFLMFKSV